MSLPGADELFRTTGGTALQSSSPRRAVPAPAGESDTAAAEGSAEHATAGSEAAEPRARTAEPESPAPKPANAAQVPAPAARRRGGRTPNRRPSGRERHDEKITVYVSAEELMDLEHARLVLRGEHGLAVDRGRIVREAVAVVLADLESRGDASILVRRLRGR
ncbi:hypothetical protein OG357_30925 [Streptomyces sp. NBC_01255]|uniref:hypothetical protein n=1 Tax=Streptomyces sp. NBC_01255 TaxID=2903798 RepID=UPI002E3168EC|nr:hypothetical protein [Streptomyces sp. NBC_01255]